MFVVICMTNIVKVSAGKRVDVFVAGEDGYACIKIPYLLSTRSGVILALGEGRGRSCSSGSCSDYTCTDLVLKRSSDGGESWSNLVVLVAGNTGADEFHRVGNAAPVQDAATGRIWVPYCRDNAELWSVYSDDDGQTWSSPQPIVGVVEPDWEWVGLGPPGGVQLASPRSPHPGRLVVPGYVQSFPVQLNGLASHAFAMWHFC